MNKKLKKILLTVLVIAAVCAALWVTLVIIRNAGRGEVNVYSMDDFLYDDYTAVAGTSGTVTTDKLQKVYLSETQTLKQVYVEQGQTVHVGDKLLACDTSLGADDISRAQAELERQKLELESARTQLEKLLKAKSADSLMSDRAKLEARLEEARREAGITDADAKPVLPKGDGSFDKPLCVVWDEGSDSLSQAKMSQLLGDKNSAYVLLVEDYGDDYGILQGLKLYRAEKGGEIMLSIASDLQIPEIEKTDSVRSLEKQLEELDEQIAQSHSKTELLAMQGEKRREIANTEIDIKLASISLSRLQREIQDGVIYSTVDGVVKVLRDEAEARSEGTAIIEVSGGGGYYIVGAVSELALGSVTVGQSVEVNSWMTGMTCEGTVTEISTDPTESFYSWGDGNPNVSYYPMKVFVDEDAELQDGDMVDMSYRSDGGSDSMYLDSMFVRSENGVSFVFVQGENGLLEKRIIQTGVASTGSTEIKSGLSRDELIAFPYGKDVVEGAKTREATTDELYSW